ncbi:MAG: carboxypeptidase regulatory-like domain-containing protein [Bacteroidota bacterium]
MIHNFKTNLTVVNIILVVSYVFLGLFADDCCPPETGEINGTVTSNGQAVSGATVSSNPPIGNGAAVTDPNGMFNFKDVPENKSYTLTASKDGYENGTASVFVAKKQLVTPTITMVQKLPVLQIVNSSEDFGSSNTVLNFTLKNQSGFGTLTVTSIGISYPANTPAWLIFDRSANITVANGTTGTTVAATADRNALTTSGNYQATVTFNSNGGNISLVVSIAKPGLTSQILVTPADTLKFGSGATSLPLTVKNVGPLGTTLQWDIVSDHPTTWLPVSSIVRDNIEGQGQRVINIIVDRSNIAEGLHPGTLIFKNLTSSTNTQTIPVSMLVVKTNGEIKGTIKDQSSNGIIGATVTAVPGNYSATSTTGGLYTLNVQTGSTYTITASKSPEFVDSSITSVVVGSTSANIVLRRNFGSISGTVVDSANELAKLQGVAVIAKGKIDNVQYSANPATTDANGVYFISNLPATQNYDVTASVAAYYPKTVSNITIGQTSLMISLGKITGSISGTVTDSTSGLKVGGVNISVDGTSLSTVTSNDGSYTLSNIPLGTYKIVASKNNYFIGTTTKDTSGVTITSSAKTVNFTLVGKLPTDGMILFYPFNGNLKDRSGYGLDATGSGITVNGSDRFGGLGNGAYFDGSSNFMFRNDTSTLHTPTALSIALWIKFDKEPVAGTNFSILDKRTGTVYQYDLSYQIDNSSNKSLVFDTYADNAGSVFHQNKMQKTLSEGIWNFICVTFNGTQSIIYVNGIQSKNIVPIISLASTINNPSQGAPIYFGRDYNNKGYLKSYIDDVRIFNKALIEAEIQALYSEGNWK